MYVLAETQGLSSFQPYRDGVSCGLKVLSKDWYIALFLDNTESLSLPNQTKMKEDFVYMGLKLRSVTYFM